VLPPRNRERGAALVEFALILPVLSLFLFGMMEFGIGFNNLNSLRQGTREGARQGVVDTFGGDTDCVVTGTTPSTTVKELICLIKDRIGLAEEDVRVKVAFPTTNDEGESLIVCTAYPLTSVTGFFSALLDGKLQTTKVEMRIESANEDLLAYAETPVPGSSWSWCD
jgi:hypothetical protein